MTIRQQPVTSEAWSTLPLTSCPTYPLPQHSLGTAQSSMRRTWGDLQAALGVAPSGGHAGLGSGGALQPKFVLPHVAPAAALSLDDDSSFPGLANATAPACSGGGDSVSSWQAGGSPVGAAPQASSPTGHQSSQRPVAASPGPARSKSGVGGRSGRGPGNKGSHQSRPMPAATSPLAHAAAPAGPSFAAVAGTVPHVPHSGGAPAVAAAAAAANSNDAAGMAHGWDPEVVAAVTEMLRATHAWADDSLVQVGD